MNKRNCIMATMAAAAMTTLSAFMWIKSNPKKVEKMKKDFNKATDKMKDAVEDMM